MTLGGNGRNTCHLRPVSPFFKNEEKRIYILDVVIPFFLVIIGLTHMICTRSARSGSSGRNGNKDSALMEGGKEDHK